MCGFCGQYNYKSGKPVDAGDINRMTDTIIHRGPDDSGQYVNNTFGFGFRRLSIIDLAEGHQPMTDEDERVWLVFNGEIYNYQDLRSELVGQGYRFRTNSDTEVILRGYQHWGPDVLNRLNGMFGIGIWDNDRKRLIIARDPMGIKPIYYTDDGNRLLFGSEMKAIKAIDGNHDIDPGAINLFLKYRYTPAPYTLYRSIRKLAPGEKLTVENGNVKVERWYGFEPSLFDPMPSPQEASEQLFEIYKGAIKRQLISDVPLGILLSGGVDSGLMLGLMQLHGDSWPAFTVGYGKSFKDDEIEEAAETAKIFNAEHHVVRLDRNQFEETLDNIVNIVEEPVTTSSIVPMYHVCELARRHVTVALAGQGPDELFGGYNRHLGVAYGEYWRAMPGILRAAVSQAVRLMPRNETLKRGIYALDEADELKRFHQIFSIVPGPQVDDLFLDGILTADSGDRLLDNWKSLVAASRNTDELGRFQHIELHSSLPDELLLFSDKISMAHSLEIRVPYLDLEVVQYVERLSASLKVRRGTRKWLHKKVSSNFLPQNITNRKKKGFAGNVVDDWFRNSMNSKLLDTLKDNTSSIYRYLDHGKTQQLLQEHITGKNNYYKILFSMLVLESWLRNNHV